MTTQDKVNAKIADKLRFEIGYQDHCLREARERVEEIETRLRGYCEAFDSGRCGVADLRYTMGLLDEAREAERKRRDILEYLKNMLDEATEEAMK